MKTLLSFLVIFSFFHSYGQLQPALLGLKGIGGNGSDQVGPHVTNTADGGFILAFGTNSSPGTGSIDSFCASAQKRSVFVKYNSDASEVQWSKCYGSAGDSGIGYFFPMSTGENVLGGMFNSSTAWGWLIAKHDAAGNVVWQHNYSKGNGALLRDMMATEDGGYIMMGEALYTDTNVLIHYGGWMDADIWLLKVDSNGNKVWSKVIGGTGHESGAALVPAPGNGFYVVGGTGSYDYDCTGNPGGGTAYIARINDTGGIVWHRCVGGTLHDAATAATSNNKGGLILAVNTSSADIDVHNFHGGSDYWAVEVDSSGNIVWDNCYGTGDSEVPLAICKATDGSIWMNGFTNAGYGDVFIVHADSVGSLLSSTTLSSSGSIMALIQERGQMIYPLQDGIVLAGGYYYSNTGSFSSITNYGANDAFLAVYAPWTTEVEENSVKLTGFKVYPNPAQKILNIETVTSKQKSAKYTIKINDIAGRQVYAGSLNGAFKATMIDVSNFMKGVYYVQIIDDEGNRYIEKIAIE